MRKIAILSGFVALILSSSTSSANDFDALLGELTFGGTPETQGQMLTMDNLPAETLAPAPGLSQDLVPEPLDAPHGEAMPEQISMPIQNTYQPVAATSCDTTFCDAGCRKGSCGGRCGRGGYCEHGSCVPHTPPNLPTSSFREYFKSDACNCRVWDGWQNRCHGASKHSRGECDCFDPSKNQSCLSGLGCKMKCFGPRVQPVSACESKGCLQLPAAWHRGAGNCDAQADCDAAPACDSLSCDG